MRLPVPPAIRDVSIEADLLRAGARHVAGVDEAGRGCWAGPVYAAVVVLGRLPFEDRSLLRKVTDSKLLSPRQREGLFEEILAVAEAVGVAKIEARLVDRIGIVAATREAMLGALDMLPFAPESVLVDALMLPPDSEYFSTHRAFNHADRLCLCVAAASICAKVSRDRDMKTRARRYPEYGFERNKGYGTAEHRLALMRHGPCPAHRRSFRPVREAVAGRGGDAGLVA